MLVGLARAVATLRAALRSHRELRRDIEEELSDHAVRLTADLRAGGFSDTAAVRETRRRFGSRRRAARRAMWAACRDVFAARALLAVAVAFLCLVCWSAHGWERVGAFEGVRFTELAPGEPGLAVLHDGRWWVLREINGVTAADLLRCSLQTFGEDALERLNEDMHEILTAAGSEPGEFINVQMSCGEDRFCGALPMTPETRQIAKRFYETEGFRDARALPPARVPPQPGQWTPDRAGRR